LKCVQTTTVRICYVKAGKQHASRRQVRKQAGVVTEAVARYGARAATADQEIQRRA